MRRTNALNRGDIEHKGLEGDIWGHDKKRKPARACVDVYRKWHMILQHFLAELFRRFRR